MELLNLSIEFEYGCKELEILYENYRCMDTCLGFV